MGRFNLIDEPWIRVIVNDNADTELVSMKSLFKQANTFKEIAGDMPVQDFAVFRFTLSVMQTYFSRYDANGKTYEMLTYNDKMQVEAIEETAKADYEQALYQTWSQLWETKTLPTGFYDYLNVWIDRFNLFDNRYPIMQVPMHIVEEFGITGKKMGVMRAKNINRLISESDNKVALFSPMSGKEKDHLKADEVARWLLTLHGYAGLADKVFIHEKSYKASKGWLFDIGGLTLSGDTLMETLLLNLVLVHPEEEYRFNIQRPAWEYSARDILNRYLDEDIEPDNLAELYTLWSRAVVIHPETNLNEPFEMQVAKIPDIRHVNQFLEPMTIWHYNRTGPNKELFTPRKHIDTRPFWYNIERALGQKDEIHQPGIITWLNNINPLVGDKHIQLHAVTMRDNASAMSWLPVGEIIDDLNVNNQIITDKDAWAPFIVDVVQHTYETVELNYGRLIADILEIRNSQNTGYRQNKIQEVYVQLDEPFKEWMASLDKDMPKNEALRKWDIVLRQVLSDEADYLLSEASDRDYRGIEISMSAGKKKRIKNIVSVMSNFHNRLDEALKGVE